MPSLVFLSLFLGLVSGTQRVQLRASEEIKSIRLLIDARELAVMHAPPWETTIDLGPELAPAKLLAIGYDARGKELARATQLVNLPRPSADIAISLRQKKGAGIAIDVKARHLRYVSPASAKITVDGAPIINEQSGDQFSAKLLRLDLTRPHIVAAAVTFADGAVAHHEVVVGGFSDIAETELTPVVVSTERNPQSLDGCFSIDGANIHTAALEKSDARILFVEEPDPEQRAIVFGGMMRVLTNIGASGLLKQETRFAEGTTARIIWPIAQRFDASGEVPSQMFESSTELPGADGVLGVLMRAPHPLPDATTPRRIADAVAVAALETAATARRRAVVLLLTSSDDRSEHSPTAVRHYLTSIGVPLFVWSIGTPPLESAQSWGEIDDVSTWQGLRGAIRRLRASVAKQRVAWLATDPLTALRMKTKETCGVTPLAHGM